MTTTNGRDPKVIGGYGRRIVDAQQASPGADVVHCTACRMPGVIAGSDERGHLIAHPRRLFPCRVEHAPSVVARGGA